jgi:hypothetical protein
MEVSVIAAEPLSAQDGVRHGFFGRPGGVSEGCYASLNCGLGSADQPERVRENRARAAGRLGSAPVERLITAFQVHSVRVAVVEGPWPAGARPQVDGLVTRSRGLALGILTADCAPVLLADATAGVIGAAHAGWRGAKMGIVETTLAAMVAEGAKPERVVAAVGPCIGRTSYEVGPEFRDAFADEGAAVADLFDPSARPGHYRFDLSGYLARRLAGLGLKAFAVLAHDTCAEADRFFSYRRTTLAGGGDYGRQISAVMLD